MTRYYSSTAQPTTLSAAATDVATTIQVAATTGFPAAEFILALDYGTAQQELVKVTNVAGTALTVVRGFDSTTSQSHSLGAAVRHVHSADDFRLSRTHEGSTSGVHGVTGALVGTTDTQVVTNKDLTSDTNTFPSSLATDSELSAHTTATAAHGTTGAVVGTSDAQTLTNKTVNLASNTVSGTTAEFNAALSDGDFATLAGSEALTNKNLSSLTNTLPAFVSPVGEVKMFAGSTAPTGYLLCDGAAVSRTTYPSLFSAIGTTYGAGDGSTTFNVPDLRGRAPVGYDSTQTEFNALGKTGGEKTHTLTTPEMPSHSHGGSTSTNGDHNHAVSKSAGGASIYDGINISTNTTVSQWGGVVANAGAHSHTITAEGGGNPHNNLQPYIALNYIIRAA